MPYKTSSNMASLVALVAHNGVTRQFLCDNSTSAFAFSPLMLIIENSIASDKEISRAQEYALSLYYIQRGPAHSLASLNRYTSLAPNQYHESPHSYHNNHGIVHAYWDCNSENSQSGIYFQGHL
jgi:hypothetical protein